MTDHFDRKDVPGSDVKGADPDVGVSVTVDSGGHLKKVEVDVHVPGTAGGSKPGHVEFGGGDDPAQPKPPGWTPHLTDPSHPGYDPLPIPPGFHRDPITGIDYPDVGGGAPPPSGASSDAGSPPAADAPMSEVGDFPEPSSDEIIA